MSFRPAYLAPFLERRILYLKRACFGLWLKERGILHLNEAHLFCFLAYTTSNITFEAHYGYEFALPQT